MSRFLAHPSALSPVENVALGDLVKSLPHELLLNHVLHVLDMNERTLAAADAGADRTSDLNCAFGVFLCGEKCLSAGDFDLALVPRNNRAVTTDQADRNRSQRRALTRNLVRKFGNLPHGALEDEALGHIVRIILDKGLFDEQGKIIVGELQTVSFAHVLQEPCGHRVSDVRYERAILLVKNILLLP